MRLLRAKSIPLRILTRAAEPAEGPDSVTGDLAKPATLDRAMAGVDQVFLLSSAAHDERAWPGQADEHLRASGVPFTIIRPNFYLHNVTAGWAPTLDPAGNYYAPAGGARISMVDARDVASVAAAALTEPGHAGRSYDVTGPEALSHAEACEKLGEKLGRTVTYVPVDDETARSAMLGAGLNQWLTHALVELYQDYRRSGRDGYAAQVHATVFDVTGTKPRTLETALAEE